MENERGPNFKDFKEGVRNYIFYILIFVVSVLVTTFLPMIGTSSDEPFMKLRDIGDWLYFIGTKALVALFNVLLFVLFVQQGKWNVRADEKYLRAREILNKLANKLNIPESPLKHNSKIYSTKGLTVLLLSSATAFFLPQCIIMWDTMLFLSCVITVVIGIIFGVIQMKNEEYWWTECYLNYALYMQEKIKEKEEKQNECNN